MRNMIKGIVRKVKDYFQYIFMTGHTSIGNLTLFGRNAMHWGGLSAVFLGRGHAGSNGGKRKVRSRSTCRILS